MSAFHVRVHRRARRLGIAGGDRVDDRGVDGERALRLARMLEEGQLPLFLAGIAVRCSIDHGSAWEILSDPEGRGSALLLRAGGVDRDAAAWILLMLNSRGRLFSGAEGEAAAAQLDRFDTMTDGEALEIIRLWQVDSRAMAAR